MQSQTRIFSRLVGELTITPPVVLPADATVAELVARMVEAKQSGALIVGEDGKPAGIVTEHDVVRRVALRCEGSEPVSGVMTSPVRTVSVDDYLYGAIATMRRFGWRHLPVVDGDGRLAGIIERHEALALAAEQTVRLIDAIGHEGTVEGLASVKVAQVEVADALFADHVPAPEIQRILTGINRDMHRRVVEAGIAAMEEDGWGPPPVEFALIIMGSGGRGESYLYPDQDNGFILDDYPDAEHTRIDGWFIELAERMTETLDGIGFPFCKGYVMATNPVWRKTRGQWRQQILGWGRRRSTIAIQLSDIFFDFRAGAGRADFVAELRRGVTAMLKASPGFLRALEQEATSYGVALGWFGRFVTEKQKPEHKGEINLKHAGTMPLVTNIRLLAMKQGIAETGTLERIRLLHEAGVLDNDDQDYLSGAFEHMTGLLLRQQIADFKAGEDVGNYVHPEVLSERERDILVDSLKAVENLQERVHGEFTAEVF